MPDTPDHARDSTIEPVAILFYDSVEFERGRVVLNRAGLIVRISQPGGNLGALRGAYGLPFLAGRLWVAPEHLDRAMKLLEESAVTAAVSGPPLVDRDEPVCPYCRYNLRGIKSSICPACGGEFAIDDDDPADLQSPPAGKARPSRSHRLRRFIRILLVLIFFVSLPCYLVAPIDMLIRGTRAEQLVAALVLTVLAAIGFKIGRTLLPR